jgi:glycosyltransferase involved in cell wall biosynthesis
LTYCFLRNLAYIAFRNVYDVVQLLKEETRILPTIGQRSERDCSTQIVIAALNEEPGIGQTIIELAENLHAKRVLVVDGKSHDRTVEVAKKCGANIVFQDGTGKGDAISKALGYMDPDVDYIVLTDADYTYPAEYVPKMIEILERNPDVGMVCGNRFSQHIDSATLRGSFYFGNKLLAFVHNLLNGVDMRDPLTGLRVIRAEILRNTTLKSKGFDVEVELNHAVERKGFKIVEVPITYRKRLGEKKLKLRHGTVILKRILLESTY